MAPFLKSIFIDESGTGSMRQNKNNLWTSAGICVDSAQHDDLSERFYDMKKECMRHYEEEMKGIKISKNHLNTGITADDVGRHVADIIKEFGLNVWVTATRWSPNLPTGKFIASNTSKGVLPKDIARELLMERISGYADMKREEGKYIIIWDLSDTQELDDFSRLIRAYVNPHSGKKVCPSIIPNILGGLSHEWPELQLCDIIANFALNYAADGIFKDCDMVKSRAFKEHIFPNLMRGRGKIVGVGWKAYYVRSRTESDTSPLDPASSIERD